MDADRFDAVTRALTAPHAPHVRRRALGALLATGLNLLASGNLATPEGASAGKKNKKKANGRRQGRQGRQGHHVLAEGPCGNGDPQKNHCKRDGQCCTGFCQKKRCRCRREGDPCAEDRNCCPAQQGLTCQDGACQPATSSCAACTGCCVGGTCQPGTEDDACGIGGVPCRGCPASSPFCGINQPGVCGSCVKRTCADTGANCGPISDGCGGLINCGPCPSGQICGGGGVPSVCGGGACTPVTCSQQGLQCGPSADGCGGVLDCGPCDSGQTCVAGECRA